MTSIENEPMLNQHARVLSRPFLWGLLALLLVPLTSGPAAANVVAGQLPVELANSGAVLDGDQIVVFGGQALNGTSIGPSADILTFDIGTGASAAIGRLPVPLLGSGVAVVNGTTYLVGGSSRVGAMGTILRFDGTALLPRATKLPFPVSNPGIVMRGQHIVILGGITSCNEGCNGYRLLDSILDYDPASDIVTEATAHLPQQMMSNAVDVNGTIYMVGGIRAPHELPVLSDEILAYSVQDQRVTDVGRPLPEPLTGAALASVGDLLVILGGETSAGPRDQILALDTRTGSLYRAADHLEMPRSGAAIVAKDGAAFLVGGVGCPGQRRCDSVEKVDLRRAVASLRPVHSVIPGPSTAALLISIAAMCCASAFRTWLWVRRPRPEESP